MRKILLLLLMCSLLGSCSTSKKISEGPTIHENNSNSNIHDGSSYEKAIIINEKTESRGVDAEYNWLSHNYPGYKFKGQALNFHEKKPYDIITILTAAGEEKKIYFDISKFFGKS